MPIDPVSRIRWGSPRAFTQKDREAYRALKHDGRLFLTTDKDGHALSDPAYGSRTLINLVQHDVWDRFVLPLRRSPTAKVSSSGSGKPTSVMVTFSGTKRIVESDPPITVNVVTRELLDKLDFRPEDVVDYYTAAPPMIEGRPASFLFFAQYDSMRTIIGNARPEKHPGWTTWPHDEADWFRDALGVTNLIVQYGHLPDRIGTLNHHSVAFSPGVDPHRMAKVIDAARSEASIDDAIVQAFRGYEWEKPLDEWWMNDQWTARRPIIEDIVKCLKAGAYGGAVAQGLAQVERAIMDYLISRGAGIDSNGHALAWEKRIGQLEGFLTKERFGPALRMTVQTTLRYLRDAGLYEKFSWRKEPRSLSRHHVLHGKSLTYVTEANAYRTLLVLDALYWTTGFLARRGKNPFPGPETIDPKDGERWKDVFHFSAPAEDGSTSA